jgi:predicted phage terminase large subunit-like protein
LTNAIKTSDLELTPKQWEAQALLTSPARYALLVGGSRSGKTFLLCRAVVLRALKGPNSRHLIARKAFNAVKTSIWSDTMPKVLRLCFPGLNVKTNKADYFWEFDNGSQIWIGGLDEKERTEKILGTEYSTVYLNEASQIGWSSVEMIKTRLAQVAPPLMQKMYVDCNPPLTSHWTHRIFVEKRDPDTRQRFENPDDYVWIRINPEDNKAHLTSEFLSDLTRMGVRARKRFYAGEWGSETENALWTLEGIEKHRRKAHPDLQRIVIGVDPSGTKGDDDVRSDHVGIVVVGLGVDGDAYVLEDLTAQISPREWGRRVVSAFDRHSADLIVAEINFGGAMVEEIVRSAASEMKVNIHYREVHASRGKVIRAEPISVLYERGKVHHVGEIFPELEDQMCNFTTQGFMGDRSPDRADALIWALSELFPGMTKKMERKPLKVEGISSFNAQRY